MCDCTCESREMTLIEEIDNLPIEESVKDRICKKAWELYDSNKELNNYLCNCHSRIHWLEKACVELSVLFATQKEVAE